jgi:hypothetical protein
MIDGPGFFAKLAGTMKSKTRNWLILIFVLAFPFVLYLGFLIFLEEPPPPLASLPNPNSYGDLARAGQMITGDVSDYDRANVEQLRGIALTNVTALALARSALSNQCGVPLQFTTAYLNNHIPELIAFRSLAQALVCEGKLAEIENRFGDAAKSYLDAVRLGNQAAHGGLLVDEMVGVAIWSLGEKQLQGIVTNLDAPDCHQTIVKLEAAAGDRQTWTATMQQEEAWSRRVFGWRADWLKLIYNSTRQKNLKRAMDALDGDERQENRLLVDLAAHAYELEKGKPPASVADLVPDYLKAIPQDPVTGTNMVDVPR